MATRADDTWPLNLSDEATKFRLIAKITSAEGYHLVMLHPVKPKASTEKHAYYRAVVIPYFRKGALAEWGYDPGDKEAHNLLKYEHLRTEPEHNADGVLVKAPGTRSCADLEDPEMGEFIEKCCNTIQEYFGVTVPPPDKNWKRHAAERA